MDTSLSVSVSDNLISSTSSPARYNIGSLLITYRSPVVTLQKRIEQEKLSKKKNEESNKVSKNGFSMFSKLLVKCPNSVIMKDGLYLSLQ